MIRSISAVLLALAGSSALAAWAAPTAPVPWTPAWLASPQPVWGSGFLFPTGIPMTLAHRTVREVVHLGYGADRMRVVFSNAHGSVPVRIARAHAARSKGGAEIEMATDVTLTFAGKPEAVLPPGGIMVSDAFSLQARQGDDVAVSLYFAAAPKVETFHWDGHRSAYVARGDQSGAAGLRSYETTAVRLFVAGVLVAAPSRATVVVLGDSITDGAGASLDRETRWPDFLAARAAPARIAVLNAGISGARLLSDGMGMSAFARLDRDVLAQPGVRTLILMLGTNDIAWPGTPFAPQEPPMTFERLTAGYRAISARAHVEGVRVISVTLPPFKDALPGSPLAATYYSPSKDALRQRVNDWIRTTDTFDAVLDFDALLRDAHDPLRLRSVYDSGDHLHPGDAGNQAMAAAVPLDTLLGDAK